jgi:hypothetical protein
LLPDDEFVRAVAEHEYRPSIEKMTRTIRVVTQLC